MKIHLCFISLAATLLLSACGDEPLSNPERDALVGGAVGAGAGAVVGSQLGSTGTGAAVGGVAGAATGAVVGQAEDRNYKDTVETQEEILKRQEMEIRRQDREIEDLNRQKYQNDSLKRFEAPASERQ